jgi:thiamine biosynthesis lipoprotein
MSKKIEFVMGMPVIVEVDAPDYIIRRIFDYFKYIDEKFSPYKQNSEVTKINDRRINEFDLSKEMNEILRLSEETKKLTNGYFDIYKNGMMDPSGIVKGWAIFNASKILDKFGIENYSIEAGGDIQTKGLNNEGNKWAIGIKNPFNPKEIIKIVYLSGEGVATSGTYERGNHIYNPKSDNPDSIDSDILSLTVIGPNVYEADRFATAAFAMGSFGINFIDSIENLEGYMINKEGIATMTRGFEKYV